MTNRLRHRAAPFALATILLCIHALAGNAQPNTSHNLRFDSLATRWDEAMPLGNGWLGTLIWKKNNRLRLSLDRIDLWDDRPMPDIDRLKFRWVVEKVKQNQYDSVQKLGDEPYEKYPAPTKIPAAALEFDLSKFGKVISNELDIQSGLCVVRFESGLVFNSYIHAVDEVGYFGWENLRGESISPEMIVPAYNSASAGNTANSVEGQSLERLGYPKGKVTRTPNSILYHQPTWNNNYYEVLVRWQKFPGNKIIGQWTIANNKPAKLPRLNTGLKEPTNWPTHIAWWKDFWNRSSVKLPDPLLEKQYYLELYKFASVARSNTPPISLQAIWTADDGKLPPWKGDYHHDLNTQLSYWPGYASNHLDLTAGFTNWLQKVKNVNKEWTAKYFEVDGLNVPGVTTISGKPMGGWIQYSMSPTTSAWLAQHFYWQAVYSMDKKIAAQAESYLLNSYLFIESYLGIDRNDTGFVAMGSSPEYHDNSIRAWFPELTNYDKGLVYSLRPQIMDVKRLLYKNPGPVFDVNDNIDRVKPYAVNETGLAIAGGQNLDESHRHHAHLMAIHPLGLLNVEDEKANTIIKNSLRHLEKIGTRKWTGYSFTWAACIYARAKEADNAVKHLQIFASNFCSPNSFHLNGDQNGGQYSDFRYRPFTLEGNFAFAQGVHELLLQSHKGYIEVFPATPFSWKDVSFKTLRTQGAFLVSAAKDNGTVDQITIRSEAGGTLRIKLPFKTFYITDLKKKYSYNNGILETETKKGETIVVKNGYE